MAPDKRLHGAGHALVQATRMGKRFETVTKKTVHDSVQGSALARKGTLKGTLNTLLGRDAALPPNARSDELRDLLEEEPGRARSPRHSPPVPCHMTGPMG